MSLLTILADLYNAIVFFCSPLVLLFSSLPVPLSILWWLYQAHQLQLVSPSLSCSVVFFLVLLLGLCTYLSFPFLSILPWDQPERLLSQFSKFLFFVNSHWGLSPGHGQVIRLYLKAQENFVTLILQNGFWVVRIPSVCMVRCKFLAQFRVVNLSHLVVSSLIHFLWYIAAFAYYVLDSFVSITK